MLTPSPFNQALIAYFRRREIAGRKVTLTIQCSNKEGA